MPGRRGGPRVSRQPRLCIRGAWGVPPINTVPPRGAMHCWPTGSDRRYSDIWQPRAGTCVLPPHLTPTSPIPPFSLRATVLPLNPRPLPRSSRFCPPPSVWCQECLGEYREAMEWLEKYRLTVSSGADSMINPTVWHLPSLLEMPSKLDSLETRMIQCAVRCLHRSSAQIAAIVPFLMCDDGAVLSWVIDRKGTPL